MHHEAVDPLGLFHIRLIPVGEGSVPGDAPGHPRLLIGCTIEIHGKRVVGERAVCSINRCDVLTCGHHPRWVWSARVGGPYILGNIFPPVTGVTGHTRATHVIAPGNIRALGHLYHHTSHFLGVLGVVLKAFVHVAVIAAFFWRYPFRNSGHQSGELANT